jgi:hypothetical protein
MKAGHVQKPFHFSSLQVNILSVFIHYLEGTAFADANKFKSTHVSHFSLFQGCFVKGLFLVEELLLNAFRGWAVKILTREVIGRKRFWHRDRRDASICTAPGACWRISMHIIKLASARRAFPLLPELLSVNHLKSSHAQRLKRMRKQVMFLKYIVK